MDSMRSTHDRRGFLRRATLAAGVPLLGGLLGARPRQPERRLGVALVGLGNLSTNQLAPALQKTRNCRLAAIVTGTPAKVPRWRERYGLPDRAVYSYDTMARLAENREVDVVYVVTPNALHADHAIAAARAGKHVFCEKPMDASSERCRAMIAACREAGRQLAIAYRCQFEPHHLEVVRLAREGAFGRVRMIHASFGFPIGDPNQWRLNRALAGGGPLMDVGIYALQTARLVAGAEPTSVSAQEVRRAGGRFGDVEESLTFQLAFPGGVTAHCGTSYAAPMNELTVYAERGSFGMKPAYNYGGNRGWRSDGAPLSFPQIDQFAAELDDFAARILAGTPTPVPGEEGLRDLRILEAVYESARSGRTVPLRAEAGAGG
jgi:predicted dehydrogenase